MIQTAITQAELPVLSFLVSAIAAFYSSVGAGGGSGYLAVLSLFSLTPAQLATGALCLNIMSSSTAFYNFRRAGHFSFPLTWPFVVSSIPCAFVGGAVHLKEHAYHVLLAVVLFALVIRLLLDAFGKKNDHKQVNTNVALCPKLVSGALIGLVAGMVGIGGGVFLGPLLLLRGWAVPKPAAACAAGFTLFNSLAGLGGRVITGTANFTFVLPLLASAFIGGMIGSGEGAKSFSDKVLRLILAFVILVAAVKLL